MNSIIKSPSHSYVRFYRTMGCRKKSPNHSSNRSNRSITNSHSPETSELLNILVLVLVTNLLIVENTPIWNRSGDQKLLIIKDPKILGYLKETNLTVLQEQSKKTYKKGIWVLDCGCSTHVCGKKKNFKTIKRIDGECVRLGDNAKGYVNGVGTTTLSS